MMDDLKIAVACGFAMFLGISGCGRSNALTEIRGTVTFDGKPLNDGTISFLPADGAGPSAAAIIANGGYVVKVGPGKKIVKIEGYEVTGKKPLPVGGPDSPMVDVKTQILSDRYNAKTTLLREVASGTSDCDFALEK